MKRFWTSAGIVEAGNGFAIALDGRRVKTPARSDLVVPSRALAEAIAEEWNDCGDVVDPRRALAEAIAEEWNDCGDVVDPRAMPLTGLANAAIDRIASDKEHHAAGLAQYGESDLTCYRAEDPDALVQRQSESWDALLAWARRRYEVDFVCVSGIMHAPQPEETVRRLAHAVASLDAFRLAGLTPLVTIGGSLVAALAVLEAMMPAEAAWEAVSLDDRWQLEQWGDDAEARQALDLRRRDFLAAARFLDLLS